MIARALAVALLLAAAPEAAAEREPITMSGAVPAAALVADLAYFHRRAVDRPPRFEIVGGNTVTGLADVSRRVSDVGLVTRPLAPGDPPGLVLTPLAVSGICLVTSRSNPVPGLTRGQVQDLVAARVTTWAQIPGSTRADAIVAGTLVAGAGARSIFEATFLDAATPILDAARTWVTDAQLRDFVRATPNAWGYVDLAFSAGLHAVPFDGVPCTRATVASGAYPARTVIGLVTRGAPRGRVARFIRWIRRSPKARRVITTRYVAATRAS